jgi:hypothetical protein
MLYYKDRTFCKSSCVNTECFRYFGEEEAEGAERWWSHDPENAPIAFSDFSKDCPDFVEPKSCN